MVELELLRDFANDVCTHGSLYINGIRECFTLEDPIRKDPNPATPHNEAKVPGRTAIPAGRYRLVYQDSPRFGATTLTLLDVPGCKYIRIHAGNTAEDTKGCVLVGQERDTKNNYVMRSGAALVALKARVPADGGWITVTDPDGAKPLAELRSEGFA